jgi:hypothetical protein
MKKVMAWVKSNLTIVILSVAMLIIIPGAFAGSWMWGSSLQKKRQDEVDKLSRDLGNSKVTYYLPSATPGGQPIAYPVAAPSSAITKHFKEEKEKYQAQMSELVGGAEKVNAQGHTVLLEGLFPTPQDKVKGLQFVDLLVGKADKPSAYEDLLKGVHAGGPADPAPIAEALEEQRTQALERVKAESNRTQLTPEEQDALNKTLAEVRLGQYRRHAQDVSVYATKTNLPADILRTAPNEPPDASTMYKWQADYWLIQDLLAIVASANTKDGKFVPVDQAVVKKIEAMALDPLATPPGTTITGRTGGGPNGTYDLRNAEMVLVVASERLPELLNAVSRTNFMSTIGLTLSEATPWQDLENGYYYGTDHVVRVNLRVQSVWLRSWTLATMPEDIKKKMQGEVATEAAAPAPAPQAPRASAPAAKPTTTTKGRPASKGGKRGGGD